MLSGKDFPSKVELELYLDGWERNWISRKKREIISGESIKMCKATGRAGRQHPGRG